MWVLIILTIAHYGYNQAAIPGYLTEVSCIAAGDEWVVRMQKAGARTPSYVCIPGPARS